MERILLSNIAAILVKDVLIDDNTKNTRNSFTNEFPLLASDTDDEALHFFLKQQRNAVKRKKAEEHKTSTDNPNGKKCKKNVVETSAPTSSDQPNNVLAVPYEPIRRQSFVEINLLNKFNTTVFEGYLHMSKMTFLRIFKRLRMYLPNEHVPTAAPPQSIFSLALWKLSTDEHFEDIGRKFNITKYVCQQVIRLFWRRISAQYDSFIQWPSTPQKRNNAITNFQSNPKLNKFRQLFGIVAIKQLDVFLEAENEERQVVLQIICDADQKVIDCFLVLKDDYSFDASPIGQTLALNVQTMPQGSYLIGNESFPLKPYLIRPIGEPIDDNELAFNAALQPALNIAQQVLDALAKRFNVLYALEARNLHEVRKIVDTVCALHNLCIEVEDDYVERKLKDIQFNWAKGSFSRKGKTGNENDILGQQKRAGIMEDIQN
uniref:DDE Tnp4 domain-containing protein n=1 Tax=Ceratitis capitata TaxID=7213 RepID=W8BYP3_CERCA